MDDKKYLKVFRKISDTIISNAETETDYDKIVDNSAKQLNLKSNQLKNYLVIATLKAIKEMKN